MESLEYSGSSPRGSWKPNKQGHYQFKAIVTDQTGRRAESPWSQPIEVKTACNRESFFAVLPVENLSDSKAPLTEIHNMLIESLERRNVHLLENSALEEFMQQNRMRFVGGVNADLSHKFRDTAGVDGVLVTSLETWQQTVPPRVSLVMRLVKTGYEPEILWIDSVGLTGDDTPGLLGLGRVKDYRQLTQMALDTLLSSLDRYFDGDIPEYRHPLAGGSLKTLNGLKKTADDGFSVVKKRYQPNFTYRATNFNPAGKYQVAVVPLLNINARKHAGKIVALHLVKQLHRYGNLRVLEPGVVRDTLLRYRVIMQAGPSLAASDVLADENILAADLIVSGKVFDFQGNFGTSKVDFSTQAFDGRKREVIWASRSFASGNDGVYFFDFGEIKSAHGLVSRMTQAAINQLEE